MPIKFDENGGVVTKEQDGEVLPVWIDEDGKESPVNVDSLMATMRKQRENENRATGELKKFQAEVDKYKKLFDGIENPTEYMEKARSAFETVANFSETQKKSKEELEAMAAEKVKTVGNNWQLKYDNLQRELTTQIEEAGKRVLAKDQQIKNMLIKGVFERSRYIPEKTTLPADIAYVTFSRYFDVVEIDGHNGVPDLAVRAFDPKGGFGDSRVELTSKVHPGHFPSDEEALQIIIESHPNAESFLKSTGKQGSGSEGVEKRKGNELTHADFYTSMKR